MVYLTSALVFALTGLFSLVKVASAPVEGAELISRAKNAIPAPPHFVIYSDQPVSGQTGPPPVAQVQVSLHKFP